MTLGRKFLDWSKLEHLQNVEDADEEITATEGGGAVISVGGRLLEMSNVVMLAINAKDLQSDQRGRGDAW